MDDILIHYGVKGMRWGVHKSDKVSIRERAGSLKRERQWKKVLGEVDNMTNDQISMVSRRVKSENEFKRLVRESKMSTAQDKKDYIRRADMDDVELNNKVTRLRIKDSLSKSVSDASKEQREFGEKVVNVGSALTLKAVTNQKLDAKAIFDTITSPEKDSKKKLQSEIQNQVVRKIVDGVAKNQR